MDSGFTGEMAYDLRQRYAKIVGDHLEDIADARKNKDYPEYFKALEDLYTIVKHKFKTKKKEEKTKKTSNSDEIETYDSLKENACKIANTSSQSWIGQSFNAEEIGKIETALRKIEMFLYEKMSEANMFGNKREQEGMI